MTMYEEQDTPACKITEIISPAFYESHRLIREEAITEDVETGGRGSAKSSFCGVEVVLAIVRHPECHAAVFRQKENTLRKTVYPQILKSISLLGLKDKFKCTVSPMECTFLPTGQKIIFAGLDDPDNMKSITPTFGYIGVGWFEELDTFQGQEQIRKVEQSIFRGGPYKLCLKSFNPPAMVRNWANQYAREPKKGKRVNHTTYLTTPLQWLGENFIDDAEHLKNTNPVAYRHEYLGEIVGSGAAVFENLEIREITDAERANFDRISAGVDWGWFPDPWAFNKMHYDAARKTLYIYEEETRRKTSNEETAAIVMQHTKGEIPVICDSAEEKSVNDYRAFGLPARGAEKGPGSVAYSMKWLQSLRKIVIDCESCPDTVKEFSEYEYLRDNKTGEILQEYPDAANHHIDAVRYGTNPIWKRRGQ